MDDNINILRLVKHWLTGKMVVPVDSPHDTFVFVVIKSVKYDCTAIEKKGETKKVPSNYLEVDRTTQK